MLFTENETNAKRLFGIENQTPYVKDSINDYVVHGATEGVNQEHKGTKAAAHYNLSVGTGETVVVRLRLTAQAEAEYPGWLAKLLTDPVKGLENYTELCEKLTSPNGAIKVFCEVA